MRRLRPLRPDELDPERRTLYTALAEPAGRAQTAADGGLHGPFDAMLRAPGTGTALAALGAALRYRGVLPARVRELAVLLVAAHHRSAYEWHAHAPLAVAAGLAPELVEAVRTGGPVRPGDGPARAAAAAVTELLTGGDLTDATWAAAVGELGVDGAVELSTLAGYYGLLAVQLRMLRVPLPEGAREPVFGPESAP